MSLCGMQKKSGVSLPIFQCKCMCNQKNKQMFELLFSSNFNTNYSRK